MRHLRNSIRAEIAALPAAIRTVNGAVLTLSAVAVSAAVATKNPATAYFLLVASVALALLLPWRVPGERALKAAICVLLAVVATVSRLLS